MKRFFVEGIFLSLKGVKKQKKTGISSPKDLEVFSITLWAENAREAVKEATAALKGGVWVGEPRVTDKSEEQKMRTLGAPELPGLFSVEKAAKK